jgi:hypothetical protein
MAAVLLLAGCASLPWSGDGERVSQALVQLSDRALATASTGEDMRVVLRAELQAAPRNSVVLVAGHRFLLSHATLDAMPGGRYRSLLAQSLELAEQTCLLFVPERAGDLPAGVDPGGSMTVAFFAEDVQRVDVGIELRQGCIVALHVAQASPARRD